MAEATDRQILEFESRHYLFGGLKISAMHDELRLGGARYHQRLRAIAAEPTAELLTEFGPLLHRLRRRFAHRPRPVGSAGVLDSA